jgi:elongator complex protein 4
MSITFKKKVSSTPNIRLPSGTRLNSNGTLLLTSSGISSLDTFIGGGLPIGSLLLIYEDKNANLSDSILRCYLSEGIYNKHDLCVAALRTDLTENLPIKEDNLPSDNRLDDENEKMKIAWRYENLSTIDSSSISNIHYDLQTTKTFPTELIDQIKIHKLTWNDYIQSQTSISYRYYLLKTLHKLLTKDYSSQQTDKRILRIGIQSLSLSLFDDKNTNHFDELFAFLYHLRILLRTSLATCIITLNEKSKLFETLADMIFELKLSNLIHNDYVAFCQLIKLPRLNTIQPFIPDTWDIGIKLLKHRRNIIFEKYSLPPDLSEDASRDEKNKSLGCAPSKQLDF